MIFLYTNIILLQLCIQVEGKVRPPAADSVIISSCMLASYRTDPLYTVQEPPVFLPNYLPFQLPMYFIFLKLCLFFKQNL